MAAWMRADSSAIRFSSSFRSGGWLHADGDATETPVHGPASFSRNAGSRLSGFAGTNRSAAGAPGVSLSSDTVVAVTIARAYCSVIENPDAAGVAWGGKVVVSGAMTMILHPVFDAPLLARGRPVGPVLDFAGKTRARGAERARYVRNEN